ncbi:MAG TPA: KAP family P-loop NTPase fold protein [Candidatus Wujingus californicus]|uniref:KAP family P-loop NTPase fold protein n=1 Tax=Candidatus Wujingus californicus TaxID=3367618 RepID=UPI001D5004A7|nr:NTPase KAP [Planctomycetota bacterium]MDO8094773.1 P-loop NTPase fold protein [Candidatus Brocadiales bacterium]MDO8131922.1 P-loop NTPase fold protein [Candidatus Brocadiales bacterium]
MEYKLPPIEIPQDDPFRFDALNRRASVEFIASLFDALKGPFVLAIDSPWGTGKTTFVRMLKTFLESKGFVCLYFNAWETDFTTDPLVAFLGELDQLRKHYEQKDNDFKTYFNKTKKIATLLAKKALPVAGKIATAGLFDLDAFIKEALADLVADVVDDAVDAYTAEKNLLEQFHKSLTSTIERLNTEGKKPQLIVFVDEVDRCRPTFAVELLERIKHLFNVPNAIFVISLDKQQLAVSLSAVYGSGINSEEYLRRFIDPEYALPRVNTKAFTKNLFLRFGFEEFFSARTHREFLYDSKHLEETFNALSDLLGLSLHAREQCFTRIRVAMMTTPKDHYFHPLLLTTLVVLKVGAPEAYKRYVLEEGTSGEVTEYLRSLKGGGEFINSRLGSIIEAHLMVAKTRGRYEESAEMKRYNEIIKNPSASPEDKARSELIVQIVTDMSFHDKTPSLAYVVNKIDLATQFEP